MFGPGESVKKTDLEPSSGSGITFMWYFISSTMVCNVYDYLVVAQFEFVGQLKTNQETR